MRILGVVVQRPLVELKRLFILTLLGENGGGVVHCDRVRGVELQYFVERLEGIFVALKFLIDNSKVIQGVSPARLPRQAFAVRTPGFIELTE